jgi:isopenicillin N synthase-like dioxygenase
MNSRRTARKRRYDVENGISTKQRPSAGTANVPVIDIFGYFGGSPQERLRIAKDIDAACRNIGFLIISGHQVPETLIDRMTRVSREFFDLPDQTKELSASRDQKVNRGYFKVGGLTVAYDDRKRAPDYRDMYFASRSEIDENDPYYATPLAKKIFSANIWPDAIPEFEQAWVDYYRAMGELGHVLSHLFALALDLPETYFDALFDKHMSTMAVNNYPDQPDEPLPDQLRCAPHTDYGAFTILKTEDKPGGLEVYSEDGNWQPVPIVPGTYIVNIGDLFARWTNDRWVSPLHRVNNPRRDESEGSRRQSIVFFFHPNYDAVIACLPSCGSDGDAKYSPITAFDHLSAKISRSRV